MRLLYVDDDPAYGRLLHDHFLYNGAPSSDLVQATRLDEAVARLRDASFDCVLLGLPLSDCDGLATCSMLCTTVPESPVVVVAATDDEAGAFIGAGAEDYLVKGDTDIRLVMRRLRFSIERRKYEIRTGQLARASVGRRASRNAGSGRSWPASFSLTSSCGQLSIGTGALRQGAAGYISSTDAPPLRLLQIEDDPAFARLLLAKLTENAPACFALEHVESLADAVKRLDQEAFDAILLDLSLPDSEELGVVAIIRSHASGAPIIVITSHDDEAMAIGGLQQGAQDYLVKSQLDTGMVTRSIRLAVARRARRSIVFDPGRSKTSSRPKREPAVVPCQHEERRKEPRYLLTKPAFAIPVLPDGKPAGAQAAEGFLVDISAKGVGFEIAGLDRIQTKRLVVGIEVRDESLHFGTIEVRHASAADGRLRVGGQFVPAQRDLLREENLLPSFDPQTCRFLTGLPEETLFRWVELGILRPMLVDRIFVCPKCRAVPTFRNGCRACGSVRLASCQLIHHFSCAHVGFVTAFECDGEIVCPKCRTRGLIVGADFEYVAGPYRCLDCEWSDSELEFVGECLRCGLRFPAEELCEHELIGYHVNRLDPLALIDTP